MLKIADGANVGGVLIDIDYSWGGDVWSAQDFVEKPFGGLSTTGLIQEEIECLASRVNGSIQIHPLVSDLDIRFIDLPRITGLF